MTAETRAEQILIVGAGAIGRGFLAPQFVEIGFEVSFADRDPSLIKEFDRSQKTYKTVTVLDDGYDLLEVPYLTCRHLNETADQVQQAEMIVFAVEDRDLKAAAGEIRRQLAGDAAEKTILNFYPDPENQSYLETLFQQRAKVQPFIVDTLVSPKPPAELMHIDPLCVSASTGSMVMPEDTQSYGTPPWMRGVETSSFWRLQRYLDLTSRLALTYLGTQKGYRYLHEAADDSEIYVKVLHLVRQLRDQLQRDYQIPDKFMNEYLKISLNRVWNKRLRFPLEHSGRHPLAYLEEGGLLRQVYRYLRDSDQAVDDITAVMISALLYSQCPVLQRKRKLLGPTQLVQDICGSELSSDLSYELISGIEAGEDNPTSR